MSKKLIVDSSTIIALERADLIKLLEKIDYEIIVPNSIKKEINNEETLRFFKIYELKGRTLKYSKNLQHLNIDKGESQCCALANKLKIKFIICDDRKFIRQKFFLDKKLQNIKVLGFSFFLHIFYKNGLIKDIWEYFDKIIMLNNWERSEILIANYTFLKEMGH